ncbi:TPA: competence protein ComEA, partial [Corynebacterium striatum]|nr:competence protein ComEA [Corynebacterium striatum]
MPHISDRLRELSRPTGEEDLLTVSYPRPRISVPPWIACTIAVLVAAGILVWLGISSRAEPYAVTSPTSSASAPSSLVVSVVGEVDN